MSLTFENMNSITKWVKLGSASLLAMTLIAGCSSDSNEPALAINEPVVADPVAPNPVVPETPVPEANTVMLAMDDGVELTTFYRLPSGDGPFPTIIVRSPYELPHTPLSGLEDIDYTDIAEEDYPNVGWPQVTEAGYALVIQHTRGREGSQGIILDSNERSDATELLQWVESQPWSNGMIGTTGDSIEAILAMMSSSAAPGLVDATFAQIGTPDLINDSLVGPGGVLKLETFFPWGAELVLTADDNHYESMGYSPEERDALQGEMLPIVFSLFANTQDAHTIEAWYPPMIDYPYFAEAFPSWNEILESTTYSEISVRLDSKVTNVPTFYVAAWFDVFGPSQINAFERGESTNGEQRLLILNGTHYTPEEPGAWPIQPMLPWFDYHLKGETSALIDMPRVIFPIANGDDEWYGATTWPPIPSSVEVWQLTASGDVLRPGEAIENGERSYVYDPEDPVPTVGGRNLIIDPGPLDQQSVREDQRADVLSYNSSPLTEDLIVAGHVYSTVSMSSDAPDTDIIVKILDVRPDGTSTLVTEGIQRVRYREGRDQELFMTPGEVYELRIDVGQIAWRFAEGNTIGVDISSSNFPQWDRNFNTGLALYSSTETRVANNVIHHGEVNMSSIELPVIADLGELEPLDDLETEVNTTLLTE